MSLNPLTGRKPGPYPKAPENTRADHEHLTHVTEQAHDRIKAHQETAERENNRESARPIAGPLLDRGEAPPGDTQPASAGTMRTAHMRELTGHGSPGDPAKVGGQHPGTLLRGPGSPAKDMSNVEPSNARPAREAAHHGQAIGGTVPPGPPAPRPRPQATVSQDAQQLAKRLFGR